MKPAEIPRIETGRLFATSAGGVRSIKLATQ
jgi:hypothetical protein